VYGMAIPACVAVRAVGRAHVQGGTVDNYRRGVRVQLHRRSLCEHTRRSAFRLIRPRRSHRRRAISSIMVLPAISLSVTAPPVIGDARGAFERRAASPAALLARLDRQRGIKLHVCAAGHTQLFLGESTNAPKVGAAQVSAVQVGAAQVGAI
jgi:hypothetical protein